MVAALSCRNFRSCHHWHWHRVLFFLPSAHRLVVELTTLLLQLIVAYVKSVSSHTMIAAHLSLDHAVVVCGILTKFWLLLETISCVIIVGIVSIVFGIGS